MAYQIKLGGGGGGGITGTGTAERLAIWLSASSLGSHPGLLADDTTGALTIGAQSDIVPMTLRAYSSGTSHIAQWQTSGNVLRGEITHDGGIRSYSTASSDGSNYERAALSVTAGSGVVLAAETAGTGADNLDVTITPAGTGGVNVALSPIKLGAYYKVYSTAGDWPLHVDYAGIKRFGWRQGYPRLASDADLSWESGTDVTLSGSEDLRLYRDAAATFAQRNGVNAQTHRIYGTYTDASNYVRASLSSSSTAVTLAAETAGTGADDIDVNVTAAGAGDTRLKIGTADRAVIAGGTVTLTESSATPILDVAVASGTVAGGTVWYTIRANDATDFQALRGQVQWSAVNKGGTLTAAIVLVGSEILAASAGTLTNTATITTGTNLITINLNAVSSLTQTTLYAYVSAQVDGTGTVTTK